MVTKTTTAVGEWENPKKSGWTALMMMNSISLYGHLNVTAKDLSLLPPPPLFFYKLSVILCGFFFVFTHPLVFGGRTSFLALGSSVWFSVLQMQLERLLARQMEILQDAAVQERLQALDWRIPPAALKYLSDAQNTNGVAAADVSRDGQGRTSFIPRNFTSAPSHTLILANLEFGLHPFPFSFSPTHIQAITFDVAVLRKPAQT